MALFGALPFFLLLSCLTFFLVLLWRRPAKDSNLPPGPPPLPWLGNLLQVDIWNLSVCLSKLQEQHHRIFTIYLGPKPVVVLCGYETIKEALVDNAEAFGGRPKGHELEGPDGAYGVTYSHGKRWRELRQFYQSTLRNLGMGKSSMEERIQEEAQFLVEALRKTEGHPFDPTLHLTHAISNVVCSIVFGQRFDYEDQDFITLLALTDKSLRIMFSPWAQLKTCFPGLMRIIPGPHHKLTGLLNELKRFFSQRVQLHRESLNSNNPRDFIDCFLNKMEQERNDPSSEFHEDNLLGCISNLIFPGTSGVSTALRYGLLFLLRYPKVEAKIHEEIDRVIGRNRSPCMDDQSQMPYIEACIHEVQRFMDSAPFGLLRSVTKDIDFQGYAIPKGTTVFPFFSTALQDPRRFETPKKFNPAHFLDENGAFKENEAFLVFGAGDRACPAENLARMELFLFFTTVLQNFSLETLQDREEIDISTKTYGQGRSPQGYQLRVVPR